MRPANLIEAIKRTGYVPEKSQDNLVTVIVEKRRLMKFGVELFVELIGYEDEAEIVAAIMDSGYDWMKDGDEVLVEFFVPWEV